MDDAQFAQATSEGEARARLYPCAVAAWFLVRRNRLLVRLSNGAEISMPVPSLEGLDDASPWALREIEITPAGTGLHFPRIDADLYVPALIERATRSCQGYTQEDWDAVSDNPPLTDEELAGMRRGPEGLPTDLADALKSRSRRQNT